MSWSSTLNLITSEFSTAALLGVFSASLFEEVEGAVFERQNSGESVEDMLAIQINILLCFSWRL
jgi:hypothetical protein